MKHIITFLLFFLFVACVGRRGSCINQGTLASVRIDKRCLKIREEASRKGREIGICYKVPEGEVMMSDEVEKLHPDPVACKALSDEAKRKCEALPPAGPNDIQQVSSSGIYHKGKLVMKDGKLVCN